MLAEEYKKYLLDRLCYLHSISVCDILPGKFCIKDTSNYDYYRSLIPANDHFDNEESIPYPNQRMIGSLIYRTDECKIYVTTGTKWVPIAWSNDESEVKNNEGYTSERS